MTDNAENLEFPAGLRVLAVDDDRVCLLILSKMLRQCRYRVTTCERAADALKLLRENKDGFDVVISDVHMPDMDGFKLLELVGLEMDLPVIMMSANGETRAVMKGIKHGACDYLLKPVRIEELKLIWQHVVRKRKDDGKQRVDDSSRGSKKRKDAAQEDEDDAEVDNEDPSTSKKPRVVWTVDLHQKFVGAVDQLGVDKAVPKRILELMDVQGLTRENVASHLQKYRLYLKRLSAPPHQPESTDFGSIEERYGGTGLADFRACLPAQALASSLHRGLSNRVVGPPNNPLFGQMTTLQGRLPYGLLDTHNIGGFNMHDNNRLPSGRPIVTIGNNQLGFDHSSSSSAVQAPPPLNVQVMQEAAMNASSSLEPCGGGLNSKPYGSSDSGIYNSAIPLAAASSSNVLPLASPINLRNELGQGHHHLLYSNPINPMAASLNPVLSTNNLATRLDPGVGDCCWKMDWHSTGFNQPSDTRQAPILNTQQYINKNPLPPPPITHTQVKVGMDAVDLKPHHAFPVCSSIKSNEQGFGDNDPKFKEVALLDAFLGSKVEHGLPEPFTLVPPMDDLLASYMKEQQEDVMELMEGDFGS